MNGVNKRISSDELLGAKEVLKGMSDFYKKIYFPSFYIDEYTSDANGYHESIVVLAKRRDLNYLRGVLQKNFLYEKSLDSLTFKEEDYGFSFMIHNIKFVVGGVITNEDDKVIRLFDTKDHEGIIYNYNDPTSLFGLFTNELEENIKVCNIDQNDFKLNAHKEVHIEEETVVENTTGKISVTTLILLVVLAIVINIIIFIIVN